MHRHLLYGALAILAALVMSACDESLSSLTGPTPNLQPTFTSIREEIFETTDSAGRRACTGCHNAVGSRFNGLDLTSAVAYQNLVNVASRGLPGATRVVPGDPDGSYLIHKIEGRAGIAGVRMPLGGPFLTSGQILVIRRWIEVGAPNN